VRGFQRRAFCIFYSKPDSPTTGVKFAFALSAIALLGKNSFRGTEVTTHPFTDVPTRPCEKAAQDVRVCPTAVAGRGLIL